MRRYSYTFYRGFTLADPRFYEDISRFAPDGDLARQVQALESDDVATVQRGPWIVCRPSGPPLPAHGWKIHVSVVPDQAARALQIVIGEFTAEPFHFKCLRDRRLVVSATSRWWQPGQVGKVIALYPRTADECRALLARLAPALDGIEGPYVLTDRRYQDSSCLYYRYGGFASDHTIEADGTQASILLGPDGEEWPDDRAPVYRTPPWVEEPFPEPEPGPDAEPASRDINGYRVETAIHHTGTGGVYLAERLADGRAVVLKESRPHTAFATDGSSGQQRLRREYETMRALHGTGVAPEAYQLFDAWEHLFLAQEYVEIGSLAAFLSARNPLAHGDFSDAAIARYQREAKTVLDNLRGVITACHDRGICYGDISLTNVLIEPETLAVRLIDFESSRPLDRWAGDTPASPGFRPPPGSPAWQDPVAFDEFGVASAELALVMPRNMLRELSPEALARSTRQAAALLKYPLGDLLRRLELPADEDPGPPDLDVVVKEAVRFVETTMTPDRDDRLFPAAPEVFATSPWPVAFGTAGVLRGLHRLTGQVHPAVRDWMDRNTAGLDKLPPGLYFGLAGVGWTLLDVDETECGLELIERAGQATLTELPAAVAEGTAGLGLACLAAWQRAGADSGLQAAARVGDHLIGTARDSGLGLYWPRDGETRHPLGYAYGSSGVATFLLYLHLATGDERYRQVARGALDYDLGQLVPRGLNEAGIGLPGYADRALLEPYWERGSAGFGSALARFCRVTGDERLRATLDQLVYWTLQGSAINPGLFSGMAGIVNVALDCAHLLGPAPASGPGAAPVSVPGSGPGGVAYRELAAGMADGIVAMGCPQPEGLAFPGHGLLRYATDFATGSTGIALVLDRLQRGGPDFNYTLDELLPEASHGAAALLPWAGGRDDSAPEDGDA
ncbi:MAG: class III lanthionine synthetase LanKC [Micromonosporaceae bacterium]